MKSFLTKILWLVLLLSSTALAVDDPLFRIKEHGKWGFINHSGDVVIAPQFDDCYYQFSEGLAAVMVNEKWGYIDRQNRMAIPPKFAGAGRFRDGIAHVFESFIANEGQGGFIDKSGQFILGPWNRWTSQEFSEGLLMDKVGEEWGYLDRTGKVKIPHRFRNASNLSDGLAGVQIDNSTAGFIDSSGNWVIRLDGAVPHYSGFAEGLAAVRDKVTGKIGYIDQSGVWKIPPQFSDALAFSQGRAAVRVETKDATGWPIRRWGVINRRGDIIAPAKYDTVWSYQEGLANVVENGKWGFLDLEGALAIPCQFNVGEPFENGLAYVRVGDYDEATEWSGYINKRGEFIWRPSDYKARDEARRQKQSEELKMKTPSITLLTDPDSQKKGLLVTCPSKIPLTGENAGKVPIRVVNLLDEEVFLEVTGSESLSYSLEHWNGGSSGGGGSFTIFPDNTNLLKRLHASSYRDGKIFTCGCCITRINGRLDPDVLDVGRARGTVTVRIRGFYRNSGKYFSESVDLPIELVELTDGQQDGADQPATAPELKSEGDKKPKPESAMRPQ